MFATLRSFVVALRASAAVGRASRLQIQGNHAEAMQAARAGLSLLRKPFVNRMSPPKGAALASLTTMVEGLAHKTSASGAEVVDLQDSLAFLKKLPPSTSEGDLQAWIPYLEAQLTVSGHLPRANPGAPGDLRPR